jgi:hypothetical protein
MMLPMRRSTATASVVLTRPGMRKEWLITYLPIRVVPERSKLIAAMIVL